MPNCQWVNESALITDRGHRSPLPIIFVCCYCYSYVNAFWQSLLFLKQWSYSQRSCTHWFNPIYLFHFIRFGWAIHVHATLLSYSSDVRFTVVLLWLCCDSQHGILYVFFFCIVNCSMKLVYWSFCGNRESTNKSNQL